MASEGMSAGPGFLTRYVVAQIGAFVGFVPLLQVLVPLRAAAIDPLRDTILTSQVGLVGAVVASLANVAFGMLSDRTQSAHGRRRPWILGGLAGTLASYALLWSATTTFWLITGIIIFQLAFNAMFAPLTAVLADDVPERQRGLMSALLGLGYPIGSLAGLAAVGAWPMPDWGRYGAVGVLVAACILPFAWRLHGHAARPRCREVPVADQSRLRPRRRPNSPILPRPASDEAKHRPFTRPVWQNFVLVWVSRMFVVTTLGITQGYMLLFLRQRGTACPLPIPPEAMIAQMTAIATACNVACGLLGGALSDRIGYRKPFVVAGGVLLAAGMLCLAFLQGCAGLRGAAALYGAGNGLYSTVDLALMVQILPSIVRAGQYLGIMNLANTVAQVIAPLLALQVLAGNTPDYRMLFCMAATMSLLGAVCILGVMSRSGLAAELRIATGEQPTDLVE